LLTFFLIYHDILKKKLEDAGANKIECFDLAGKLISDAMQGLNLNHNIAKKI
jgi:hypothetical protein